MGLINYFVCITSQLLNPKPQQVIQSIKRLSLVSNKNLSEILPSNDLGPWPGEVGQGGLKVLHS